MQLKKESGINAPGDFALWRHELQRVHNPGMPRVTYRITKHADNRFAVEVRNEDHGGWRTTGEYFTWRQADAEKARLQKLADIAGQPTTSS